MRYYFSGVLVLLIFASAAFSAETRSLTVVAKSTASNKTAEVKLYNKTYALIIGIDKYLNLPPDRQLQNAVKDAKGVEQLLKYRYQFDRIITLFDEQATKDRILEILTEELPAQMGEQDALLVFWAGHGNQEQSKYGDLGYLIPFDGSTEKIRKNLTMAEIRDTISKKLPAKHVFYIMDACYSGLLTSRSVDRKTRRDLDYLNEITKESVRQVLTAGSKNEEALDGGPKGHSVFTGRFIEILENSQDFITANELQAIIKEKVHSDAMARNHRQTPGFGPLYGLGDFVFIPKQTDRLGNLTGTSAARQKELEQLKKAEHDAETAKQQEQMEIARKLAEIETLEKQIEEMKKRLGTSSAQSNDSLDAIIAMAEKKELQGQRLEELRRQRKQEEIKRLHEIERLKKEAVKNRIKQIESDLAKYQKVTVSKYANDLSGAAWNAMLSGYPEAKDIKTGDIEGFLAALGLTQYDGAVVTEEVKAYRMKLAEVAWTDPRTGLAWAKEDNGEGITWENAKSYCEKYSANDISGWRMPTRQELETLAADNAYKNKIKITNISVWNSTDKKPFYWMRGGSALTWCFEKSGCPDPITYVRALPVRTAR